jgi:hypothetical protein
MKYWGALLCFILSSVLRAQTDSLIISEIMFYPVSGNNEFIEIYNPGSDTIDLSNCRIKYYTSTPDTIISAGYGTLLSPGCYAVVLEGDYDFTGGVYKDLIPSEALILKITSNAFGSNGMANTTSRPVWLLSPQGDTTDYYFYSADNIASVSDEKKIMIKDSSSLYWKNSLVLNGTPGFRNSVHQYLRDLAVTGLSVVPDQPLSGEDIELFISIYNRGLSDASDFIINLYNDANMDSLPAVSELFYTTIQNNLSPGDTMVISADIYNAEAGVYHFIAEALLSEDEFLQNNYFYRKVPVLQAAAFNSVVINEIMYAPRNNEPEWVELFNNTAETLNLKKWKIGDAVSSSVISTGNLYMQPYSYLVLAKDSSILLYYPDVINIHKLSFPALNNTGDAVVIKDSLNSIIDSLFYTPSWGGADNKSLERISPDGLSVSQVNWGTSVNRYRATPGFKNSLTPKSHDAAVNSFRIREKYGVAGEDVNFRICIRNRGLIEFNDISISLYHDINFDSAGAASELITTFFIPFLDRDDSLSLMYSYSGFSVGGNYFIAVINNHDEDIYNNISFCSFTGIEVNFSRKDIIINEIMYAPDNEPEWIELYNQSAMAIDLKNFRIADRSDTLWLTRSTCILPPSEYLVISSDTTLLQKRNIPSLFLRSSLPSLNNAGDRLILVDSLHRVIDSLEYSPYWGGKNGFSLERISFFSDSEDSLNWRTSVNKYKGTPGYINSVSVKSYDAAVSDIILDPPFPVKGDTVRASVLINNKGKITSEMVFNLYLDADRNSVPEILIHTSGFILPGEDSVIISDCYTLFGINCPVDLFAEVIMNNDQDTSNNYLTKEITHGFEPGSIIINEVLFSPSSGEPEWIELYNRTEDTINIKTWSIRDVLATPSSAVIKNDYLLHPSSFLIISSDTSLHNFHRIVPSDILQCSIPNLNNDADGVVIIDNRGITIDSMFYRNIFTGGRSLERISSDISSALIQNWNISKDVELSTPGRINSVTLKNYDLAAGGLYFNPRFPVLNDTVFLSAMVKNLGICPVSEYEVLFYSVDPSYALLFNCYGNNLNAGDSAIITSPVPLVITHAVTLAVEILSENDADPLNNYYEKKLFPGEKEGSLVINEIMYDPVEGCPEWIEIYNPADQTFNLKNWSISDLLPSPMKGFLASEDIYIDQGSYFIIAQDSSIIDFFPFVKDFLVCRFGSLSSSGDGVMLYDYRDGIIDSVRYSPKWGGKKGVSLERKSVRKSSSDSSNWSSSLSPFKATPGKENSISNLPDNQWNEVVINEIMYDPSADNAEFIELFNRSDGNINIGGWRLEDENRNFYIISDSSFILPAKEYFTFAADSSILFKYPDSDFRLFSLANTSTLGLSNSGETVILKDLNGNIIDSVYYSPKYHNKNFLITKNRSLERISPDISSAAAENWSTSTSHYGATPGEKNSVLIEFRNMTAGVTISPNPFSPDNDGWEDFAIINYDIKTEAPQLRIKIFDSKGRLVRTLADNIPSGSKGSVIFDGRDDEGRALRIGIYILYFEAAGISGTEFWKSPFVIARKL